MGRSGTGAEPDGRTDRRWWQHPAALVTGVALTSGGTWLVVGTQPHLAAALVLAVLGVPLAVTDLAHHRLPNRLLATAGTGTVVLLALAAVIEGDGTGFARALLGGCVLGAGFLGLALLRPTGLGMGDVKLAAVLGLWLGWLSWPSVLLGVLAAFVGGGLISLLLLLLGRVRPDSHLPFGPWLLLGAAVATVVHECSALSTLPGGA